MAFKINPDTCINCGACEGECPVNAISEKNDKRVIDSATCVSCGSCTGACPVEAISEE
jgi:ferredoxin